jgi:hypothetical protein
MAYTLLDGQVSGLARGSETFGSMRNGRGMVNSNQMTSFRIGGKPAQLKSKQLIAVADGDRVIAAGKEKSGVLTVDALQNVTAGNHYYQSVTLLWILAVCSLALGVPFSFIIIGLPLVGLGIWAVYMALRVSKNIKMVKEAVAHIDGMATPVQARTT